MKKTLSPELNKENAALKAIFQIRKKGLGLTQESIADDMGITQGAVSNYLNGVNALNVSTALKFSKLLKVPVEEFSKRLAAEISDIPPAGRLEEPGQVYITDDREKPSIEDLVAAMKTYSTASAEVRDFVSWILSLNTMEAAKYVALFRSIRDVSSAS